MKQGLEYNHFEFQLVSAAHQAAERIVTTAQTTSSQTLSDNA